MLGARARAPAMLRAEACACHFRSGKVLVGKYLVEEALVVQDELVQLDDVLLLKRWLPHRFDHLHMHLPR